MSNAVYAHETSHRHPRNRAKTSARAILRKQREAQVLQYRLQRHSFAAIAKLRKVTPTTAYRYAVKALAEIVPVETKQEVLRMELAALDVMEASIFKKAARGDVDAIDACFKIKKQRGALSIFVSGWPWLGRRECRDQ